MDKAYEKYRENGFACLPCNEDKSPAVPKWYGDKIGTNGIKDLNEYRGAKGIGIVCGVGSKGLECLDFDDHYGDAKQTLTSFIQIEEVAEILKKYKLPINGTQSGGYHVLFRSNDAAGNQKLASKPRWDDKTSRWKPDAIIETRGEGGYFCAPPTKGYKQLRNSMFNIAVLSKEEREVLLTACKSFNVWDATVNDKKKSRASYSDSERVGDKYDSDPEAIFEAKTALSKAGWAELANGRWRRPDKTKGISATFGKVADHVFYCFTSNGYPFNNDSGYTPFQVVGLLDYDGDFKAFAKDLGERYKPLSYGDDGKPVYAKAAVSNIEKEERVKNEMEDILADAFIDTSIAVPRPPSVIEIRDTVGGDWGRVCTLGNFSAITGKAKSKKTFFTSMINAAAAGNRTIYNRIRGVLPESKSQVIRFDTEQANYDAYIATKRIEDMAGVTTDHFATFDLREYDPLKRCDIIAYALEKYKDNIGLVIIDGIADLATTNGDEVEGTRVVSLLLKWTKIYNCHIMTVIHQNKENNYATGHLGSAILKKAEAIIAVNAVEENTKASDVVHEMQRGAANFNEFTFVIDDNGMPVILGNEGISTTLASIHENF